MWTGSLEPGCVERSWVWSAGRWADLTEHQVLGVGHSSEVGQGGGQRETAWQEPGGRCGEQVTPCAFEPGAGYKPGAAIPMAAGPPGVQCGRAGVSVHCTAVAPSQRVCPALGSVFPTPAVLWTRTFLIVAVRAICRGEGGRDSPPGTDHWDGSPSFHPHPLPQGQLSSCPA